MKNAKGKSIRIPPCTIEDVEDAYSLYVGILGLSEDVFWYSDISFVGKVTKNISAYSKWFNNEKERMRKNVK